MNTIDNKISYDGRSPLSPHSPLSQQTFIIWMFCPHLRQLALTQPPGGNFSIFIIQSYQETTVVVVVVVVATDKK